MSGYKSDRLSEDVKREMTDILRTLKDPRISGLISVVRVELAKDLSLCKVYVSSIDGIESAKQALKGLDSASGFVRRELAARISMRRSPAIKFIADGSIEYGARISKMIDELKE